MAFKTISTDDQNAWCWIQRCRRKKIMSRVDGKICKAWQHHQRVLPTSQGVPPLPDYTTVSPMYIRHIARLSPTFSLVGRLVNQLVGGGCQ